MGPGSVPLVTGYPEFPSLTSWSPRKLNSFNTVNPEALFNTAILRERKGSVGSQRSDLGDQDSPLSTKTTLDYADDSANDTVSP